MREIVRIFAGNYGEAATSLRHGADGAVAEVVLGELVGALGARHKLHRLDVRKHGGVLSLCGASEMQEERERERGERDRERGERGEKRDERRERRERREREERERHKY